MSAPPSAAFWLTHVAFNTTSWASIWGTDAVFCDALIEHLTPEAKAHLRFLVGRMGDDDDDDDALFGTARSREDTGPHGTLRKQTRAGALAALATPVDARPTPASIPEEDELEPTDNDDDDDAPLLDDDIEDDDDDEEEAEAAAAAARARRRAVPPIASEDDDEPARDIPPIAEEDDEDDDDEEESPPMAARRPKRGAAAAAPPPRSSRRVAEDKENDAPPKRAKKAAPAADDGDEEDAAPPKRAKKARAAKADDDDDEEAAPKRAKQAAPKRAARAPAPRAEPPAARRRTGAAADRRGEPAARWGHAAVVLGDTLVVLGGETEGDEAPGKVHAYTVRDGWTTRDTCGEDGAPAAPTRRAWAAAAVDDGDRVVVFGGTAGDGAALGGAAQVFDFRSSTWAAADLGARPGPRCGHGLVRLAEHDERSVVAVGGHRGGRKAADATALDALGAPFGARALKMGPGDSPPPGHAHGCVVPIRDGAAAVVFSGASSASGRSNGTVRVLEFSAERESWSWFEPFVVGDALSRRRKAACCLLPDGKSVLVHGGLGDDGAALEDARVLDTELWEWVPAPTAARRTFGARAGHTISLLGDTLVAFGGVGRDSKKRAALVQVPAAAFDARGVGPALEESIGY